MSDPSKYDAVARYLVDRLGADAVVVVVINGPFGHGGCAAMRDETALPLPEMRAVMTTALRLIADDIESKGTAPTIDPNNPTS
jgi:hypothetical protein